MKHYNINIGDRIVEASQYQDEIFDEVSNGVGNIVIKAAAGSAKTTTIIKCMEIIGDDKKILFVAFNRAIVETVKDKLQGNVKNKHISTFHSIGQKICMENKGENRMELNEYKYTNYINEHINELTDEDVESLGKNKKKYMSNIKHLVDYCRYYLEYKRKGISKIADKYGITPVRDEFDVVSKILAWGMSNLDTIDYTDMVWLPNANNYNTKSLYDWILIDEAQDTSIAEQRLIAKCKRRGCRVITCGDDAQQINVWAGSTEDAIKEFMKDKKTKQMSLPISYRCPKKIVKLAAMYSDNIQVAPDAIEGEVRYDVSKNLPYNGDMVLCRMTAPLIDLHLHYIRCNKKSYIKGSEIIKENYLDLIDSCNSKFVDKNCELSDGLYARLNEKLMSTFRKVKYDYGIDDDDAYYHPSVVSMYDTIMGIKIFAEGCTFVDEVNDKISTILNGDLTEGVQLSTIHKAKGLEADNVYILCSSLMPSKLAVKDWEIKCEKNLVYVAITRAKKTLSYIDEEENKWNFGKRYSKGTIEEYIKSITTKPKEEKKETNMKIFSEVMNLAKQTKAEKKPKKKVAGTMW